MRPERENLQEIEAARSGVPGTNNKPAGPLHQMDRGVARPACNFYNF
jgi:hypothetical protein